MSNKNAWLSALALSLLIVTASVGAEVVVTGTKRSVDTRSPISVVTHEEILNSPTVDLSDIIGQAPGVRPPNYTLGGTATINIRGFDSGSSPVLVDGVLIDSGIIDLNTIPTHLIDRVEILKGPQGTLFGNSAASGAVNIVTQPDFKPYNPLESYVFNDLKNDLAGYWLAVESEEECDASHGTPMPSWTFSPDTNYGQPWISPEGDIFAWGDKKDGFGGPSVYPPMPTEEYVPKVGFLDLRRNGQYTYNEFNTLRARIRDYAGVSDDDKRSFIFGLFFGTMFSGFGSLSDDAVKTGKFYADETFDEFVQWAQNLTDEDRETATRLLGGMPFNPYAGVDDIPEVPTAGDATPPPTAGSSPAPMPDRPPPFDRYPYPPDYAFDLNKCDDEIRDSNGQTQKDRMIWHIAERDQARANHSYYNDFLRSQYARTMDASLIADALTQRDESNEALKAEWWNCTQGIATSPNSAAGLQADTKGESLGMQPDVRYGNKWSLNVHVEYAKTGEDGPSGPARGIAGRLQSFDWGSHLGAPFSLGVEKKPDVDADKGSTTEYSDEFGVLRFNGAISGKYLYSGKPGAGYAGSEYDDDKSFSLGAGYRFNEIRQKVGKDWNIYLDYDWKLERGGPSIGLKYEYTRPDSAYLEAVPHFVPFNSDLDAADYDAVSPYVSDYFEFGGKSFFTFDYSQFGSFDPGVLDKYGTYAANNECGDSALPPEGSGYLTAAQSPVKKVSDQWAFKHVGVTGTDSSLAEFEKPVIVAVIDTGLDWHHLDFSWENLWRNEDEIPDNGLDDDNNGYVDDIIGWSFTDNKHRPWDNDGHGTFVAGVIAATQGNDAGIEGINSNAKIMVLKALNNFGRTRATLLAKAIVYAADNGAQLINLSVTGPGFPKIVQDAVDYASGKDVLVINAAGNRAEDIDVEYPDALRGVLTVAATGPDDERAVFSNVGNAIRIAAPGIDVVSLRARATDFMYNRAETSYVKEDAFLGEDRRYYRGTGTSFATPIVTGVASLLLSRNPELKPADVVRIIEQSARDVGAPGRDRFTGYGVVDAKAALAADPAFFIYAEVDGVQPVEIDGQEYVEVLGVAEADQFKLARLEIGQGASPSSWTGVSGVLPEGVFGGSLGRVPIDSFKGAETWTIRLSVEHTKGRSREARLVIKL